MSTGPEDRSTAGKADSRYGKNWTPEEERTLIEGYKKHGPQWDTLTELMGGRKGVLSKWKRLVSNGNEEAIRAQQYWKLARNSKSLAAQTAQSLLDLRTDRDPRFAAGGPFDAMKRSHAAATGANKRLRADHAATFPLSNPHGAMPLSLWQLAASGALPRTSSPGLYAQGAASLPLGKSPFADLPPLPAAGTHSADFAQTLQALAENYPGSLHNRDVSIQDAQQLLSQQAEAMATSGPSPDTELYAKAYAHAYAEAYAYCMCKMFQVGDKPPDSGSSSLSRSSHTSTAQGATPSFAHSFPSASSQRAMPMSSSMDTTLSSLTTSDARALPGSSMNKSP